MIVDNPTIEILTALIPGNIDDMIIAWLKLRLPIIITELQLVKTTLATLTSDQIVAAGGNHYNKECKATSEMLFCMILLCSLRQDVAKARSKQLNWTDAVYLIEWFYQEKFKVIKTS